jgi:hypothetical protein
LFIYKKKFKKIICVYDLSIWYCACINWS